MNINNKINLNESQQKHIMERQPKLGRKENSLGHI